MDVPVDPHDESAATASVDIAVFRDGAVELETTITSPIECGRQKLGEPDGIRLSEGRLVIAPLSEVGIPRDWFVIEPLESGRAHIKNSKSVSIPLQGRPPINGNEESIVALPATISFSGGSLRLSTSGAVESLAEATLTPLSSSRSLLEAPAFATLARSGLSLRAELDQETIYKIIQGTIAILQSAVGTDQFFPLAATSLVELTGLDAGYVLLKEDTWKIKASSFAPGFSTPDKWRPSRAVVNKVIREKKTSWMSPHQGASESILAGGLFSVGAPLLDAENNVIGVLYGERRSRSRLPLQKQEILLVELVAWGVALGLARLEMEEQAVRGQALLGQFFTPELAHHLQREPELLVGRETDVTMLNCDIRGFSSMCHDLGAERTLKILNRILEALSDCVLKEEGVLVDYVGDELMSMWGAPKSQPDHADRACRAALAMLQAIDELNKIFQKEHDRTIAVIIGISSGLARVGNVGSNRKFKYGALGSTVNLASRTQGANKYFRTTILITDDAKIRLASTFLLRRLGQVKTINLPPITMHELMTHSGPEHLSLKDRYEEALHHFEAQEFRAASRVLTVILSHPVFRDDGPTLVLLNRSVALMVDPPLGEKFDPAWELPGK